MSKLVYHTTRLENIPGIRAHGLLTSFRKDRAFERDSLGINSKIPMIYLSKDLHHLCIPPMNDRVVLQIDIPDKIYKEWDRVNLGDPAFQAFKRGNFKNWHDFCIYMVSEMRKQDPKLDATVKREIQEFSGLENTPRFKHAVSTYDACCPKGCLMTTDDIPPEWIRKDVLTMRDLNRKGIYFGV